MTNHLPDKNWVSRTAIMQKTGVSESQLNAYISAGILPKPVVREAQDHGANPAEIEFFPGFALWRINLVKRLEAEGESMEAIAGQFGKASVLEDMDIRPGKRLTGMKKPNDGFAEESPALSSNDSENDEIPILLENKISEGRESLVEEVIPDLSIKPRHHNRIQTLFGTDSCISRSLCVLSSQMSASDELRDSMMPEAYLEILNEVFCALELYCKKHHGIIGQNQGDQAQLYFLQNPDTNYISDALNCALDIMDTLKRLKQTRKAFSGLWQEDAIINIGIAEGTEFLGVLKSDRGSEIKALGHAVKQADLLSGLGKNGEIWITKTGIGKLGAYALNHYEFGIQPKMQGPNRFRPGMFARIRDLLQEEKMRVAIPWAQDLIVAQVMAGIKESDR
ncbi:MAG: hypothetical protein KKF30_14065 [Proteobacteria bacterium]|nr:hypothetical protein [Pseudomonadota bacterium]MBU4469354.1 hypothetical protein [Pseudomonadota bacterium]MCG2753569.1 hypothetical protein [Desulfobacteraceae bacterium]